MQNLPCDTIFNPAIQSEARQALISALLSIKDESFDIHALFANGRLAQLTSSMCFGVRITPLGIRGKVGVPYKVQWKNETYILKTSEFSPLKSLRKSMYKETSPCMFNPGAPGSEVYHLGLDEFTNELSQGYVLRNVFETGKMKSLATTYIYGATYNREGAILMEYADIGTLNDIIKVPAYMDSVIIKDSFLKGEARINVNIIKERLIYGVIAQVLTASHYLGLAIQFSSGDLKSENVLVFSTPMRGTYRSLNLSCPFTCKISDFGKSSCTIYRPDGSRMRVFNESLLADAYLRLASFRPNIHPVVSNEGSLLLEDEGESWYKIDDTFVAQTYVWMRHSGDPYYKSFDYYTFMVSLLSVNSFYYGFFTSQELITKFWKPMWLSQQEADSCQFAIHSKMLENNRIGTTEALELLKDRRLLCNVIDTIVEGKRK